MQLTMIYRLVFLGFLANLCLANSLGKYASNMEKLKEEKRAPIPYNFEYNSRDENGTTQFRKETSDSNGKVQGRYGYKDMYGIERIVEYTADENGYRAEIKTNEPGTENKNPAAVHFNSLPMSSFEQRGDKKPVEAPKSEPATENKPALLSQQVPSSGSQYFFIGEQPQSAAALKPAADDGVQKYSFFGTKEEGKADEDKPALNTLTVQPANTLTVQPQLHYAAPQQFQYIAGNPQTQYLAPPVHHYYQHQYASPVQDRPLSLTNFPQGAQPIVYHYNPQPLAYHNTVASPAYSSYGLVNYSLQGQQLPTSSKA